ncbi:efflux RND transporter periplasmic adaptor subunit [Paracoccus marinaquae]|uniref:Efflux RND transporter periplasmic adaptor subunit n=1 Tax=Paracoccus marinaquae TaxID=2841926 RepID=A0ABS6AIQ0_9RHOB|nr:efflux RND transporter periplasmic adaptor subunit [Paracoccus marinaquae]MBU3029256.1 efflux RND transporter periplasmic adaptor subunit [Paracoccus marinaquae]
MRALLAATAAATFLLTAAGTVEAQPAPAVVVAPAEIRDLRGGAQFTGRVISLRRIDVIARVGGFLEEIGFTEGKVVSEGDLLFRLEDDGYASSLLQAEAGIKAAEAQLKLADIERQRRTALVQRDAVAQSELDVATANYDVVAANLASLEAQKAAAELNLSYTRLEAPFSGVVGLSAVDVGALVGPESGPLTTLTSLNPISVEFPVATSIFLNYKEQIEKVGADGAEVSLTLPNGKVFDQNGRIDFISSAVDTGTDTVRARALFDNPDGTLLDGTLVGVNLTRAEPEMVLSVPVPALQRDQQGYYVLLVDENSTVERRRVTVADNIDGFAVIDSGLEEGDLVITQGQNKVRPGVTVDAATAAEG